MPLRDFLGAAMWHLSAPYRAGREFVEARPSAQMIKTHFQHVEPQVKVESTTQLNVVLAYPAAPDAPPRMLREIEVGPDAMDRALEYAEGVKDGWLLCREEMLNLRRSEAKAQLQFIAEHVRSEPDIVPVGAPEFA